MSLRLPTDKDLRDTARVVVASYLMRIVTRLKGGKIVGARQAEFARTILRDIPDDGDGGIFSADLAEVSTADLMRIVNVGNRG